MSTKYKISPSKDGCSCYSDLAPAPIFPGHHHQRPRSIPQLWGLPRLCLHLLHCWLDGILLPPLHVGQAFQAPACWSATGNQAQYCHINLRWTILMWCYPALRNQLPALDLNIIHPLSADCLSLLHLYDRKHQFLRLGSSPWEAAEKGSDLLGLDFWHSALYCHHHSTSHCIDGTMEGSQVTSKHGLMLPKGQRYAPPIVTK